jgi:hypothetical protein
MDAQGRQLERRLANGGGLSIPQQRANEEIENARKVIAGMSADEIRQKTTPSMASGRDNPLYDGRLASAVKLSGKRKYGEDQDFGQGSGNQAASKAAGTPKERALSAMTADPAMKGFSLGDFDGRKFKVLDASGKHVGYYGGAR